MKRKPGWNRSKKTGRFISKAAFNRWYKEGGKRGPQKRRKVKAKEKYIEFEIAIQYRAGSQGQFTFASETPNSIKPRKRSSIAHARRDTSSNTKRSGSKKNRSTSSHKTASNRLGKRTIKRKRGKKETRKLSHSDSVYKLRHKSSRRKSKTNPSRRSS